MTKILIDRSTVEQALKALKAGPDVDPIFAGETEDALRAALAQDQLHDQQLRDDAERWRNIRGYVEAMEDEICALRSSLRAALAEPEPCQYPDCVDNGPDGKCIRWLLDECSKSEDYKPQRPAEPQEPDSPERRCGGPGCDMTCCQPVAQRGAMFHTHPAVERQRSVEAAVRPACGVDPAAKAETVQEPVAYSEGRTLHWHDGKGVNDAQLYLAPPQRKPLSGVAIYGLFVRSGLGAYHQKDFVVQTEYDRCIERFARAVERAHGVGGEE